MRGGGGGYSAGGTKRRRHRAAAAAAARRSTLRTCFLQSQVCSARLQAQGESRRAPQRVRGGADTRPARARRYITLQSLRVQREECRRGAVDRPTGFGVRRHAAVPPAAQRARSARLARTGGGLLAALDWVCSVPLAAVVRLSSGGSCHRFGHACMLPHAQRCGRPTLRGGPGCWALMSTEGQGQTKKRLLGEEKNRRDR